MATIISSARGFIRPDCCCRISSAALNRPCSLVAFCRIFFTSCVVISSPLCCVQRHFRLVNIELSVLRLVVQRKFASVNVDLMLQLLSVQIDPCQIYSMVLRLVLNAEFGGLQLCLKALDILLTCHGVGLKLFKFRLGLHQLGLHLLRRHFLVAKDCRVNRALDACRRFFRTRHVKFFNHNITNRRSKWWVCRDKINHAFRRFLPSNPWNNGQRGILCLTQRFNTLGALINLLVHCSVLFPQLDVSQVCAAVGGFCGDGRSSDPRISVAVQTLARGEKVLSAADPVGVSIERLAGDWSLGGNAIDINTAMDGQDKIWTVSRGQHHAELILANGLTLNGSPVVTGARVSNVLFAVARVTATKAINVPVQDRPGNEHMIA